MKPRIVVMYGGESQHADTSRTSGAWVCQHIPKSEYDVTPVAVTHDGLWKVPLGTIPKIGNAGRTIEMLEQASPALDPKHGLEKLLQKPVDSIITVLRGKGGDDGAMHSLGDMLKIKVAGSNTKASTVAHNKHQFLHAISHIAPTPYSQVIKKQTSMENIGKTLRTEFELPFFVKPVHGSGSHKVLHVRSMQELDNAIQSISESDDDSLIQEQRIGDEFAVTVYKQPNGSLAVLPISIVAPKGSSFFDYHTKTQGDHSPFFHNHSIAPSIIHQAQAIAQDIYNELECDGICTIDMISNNGAIDVLELNTVPTFTNSTPIIHQSRYAGMHPEQLLRSLLP